MFNFPAAVLVFVFLGIPAILTILNIGLIVMNLGGKTPKKFAAKLDTTIFVLGILFTVILCLAAGFVDWNIAISSDRLALFQSSYTPVSFASLPTFIFLCILSIVGYAVPRICGTRLPPLAAALCYAGMFLGFALIAVITVQLWANIGNLLTIYLLLFPFNYILCCVRLMRTTVREYSEQISKNEYTNPVLKLCRRILGKSAGFMLVSFVLAVPLLFVIIIILLLFGQKPDSVITAFTDTAEWTLSQRIPPPRLDPEGHYLCTVAACGDKKIVKPLRAGKRNGRLIIVNRQLLVANAFEELIAEKTPRFHKFIRRVYDTYGLPISRYITTKRRSNMVYFLMKPLEWLFLMLLYTFDKKPENRIARQYTGQ